MEQETGSKLGTEYVKEAYCHLTYLAYTQSISCEMPGWMKQKLESRLWRGKSIISDMQMISPLMAECEEEMKRLLMKVKEESGKPALKLNIQKTRSWHLVPSLYGK